jgi:hypothetical protein
MNLVILCCWSSILIFLGLVLSKYRWTIPPWPLLLLFAAGAILAATGAVLTNLLVSNQTELWFFSANKLHGFLGFMIGAGFGEEFWKFGVGLLLLALAHALGWPLRPPSVAFAFVVMGLSFGAIENLVSYNHLDVWLLISRGVTAVPLHGTMGMFHGLAAVLALRFRLLTPLILGYLLTVALHTLYDVIFLIAPEIIAEFLVYGMVTGLAVAAALCWWALPELHPSLDLAKTAPAKPIETT